MIELICLGVGKGMTHALRSEPSSSFVLLKNGNPIMLVDCGSGILKSYTTILDSVFPKHIFITHNHTDHTGDLPLLFLGFQDKRNETKIIGGEPVINIVRNHRLHEVFNDESFDNTGVSFDSIKLGEFYNIDSELKIEVFESKHNYVCFGFILYNAGNPIISYSGDSGFDINIYKKLAIAPIIVLDARASGNKNHASFKEVESFASRYKNSSFFITHYESSDHIFSEGNIQLLKVHDRFKVSN